MQDRRPSLPESPAGRCSSAFDLTGLDRYIEENGIPEEDSPAAFARWIAEKTGGPEPRFEKVEKPEDE